jgi:biotin operon repressor
MYKIGGSADATANYVAGALYSKDEMPRLYMRSISRVANHIERSHLRLEIITIKTIRTMETKAKVLATMKEAGEPMNAGKIAELSGLDRKEVDKAMKQLKDEGAIVSPVRCKWAPAK